ncbi:MAG: spinster family MFS transporter [Gammaproteobacteria bacterium]
MRQIPPAPPGAIAEAARFTAAYRWYALGLLLAAYTLNYLDRIVLSIVLQPIKTELQLSDTQLGLLTGFSFAALYVAAGLPIARLADHYSRRAILTACIAVWSGMTAVTAWASTFAHLLLARMGVAVGESGCSPAAQSLISDLFPRDKRATAMSIFGMGVPLGMLIGMPLGGIIAQEYGWRAAFLVAGVPGIVLAVLFALTMREPPRGHSDPGRPDAPDATPPPLKALLAQLWHSRAYRHAVIATMLNGTGTLAGTIWVPAFLMRSYGLSLAETGIALGIINGALRALGTWLGGFLSDRLAVADMRRYLGVPALITMLAFPINAGGFIAHSLPVTLLLLGIASVFEGVAGGPTAAACQRLAPVRGRAMAAAVNLVIVQMLGLGLGMQVIGIVSDALNARFGQESLRYALLCVSVVFLWAGLHLRLAARALPDEVRRAETGA